MSLSQALCKRCFLGFAAALLVAFTGLALGQQAALDTADDMVGQPVDAWTAWQAATRAIEREELDVAGKQFEALSNLNLSPLRLALMADRTGSLRLEQWAGTDSAPQAAKKIAEMVAEGRRQRALAEDGWHFSAIGRFNYADANFKALDESNPDPVALLELARYNPNRHTILIKLLSNTEVGPAAKRFLEILNQGEELLRMDVSEIAANVLKLGRSPREVHHATSRLKASGEYAVPQMIANLRDSSLRSIHPAIIQVLPQLGRDAMNPLCAAMAMEDAVTKQVLIKAMGQIGYKQALPYLAKLAGDSKQAPEVAAAAKQAMSAIGSSSGDVAALFLELAEGYYGNLDSLRADPRRDTANVWYLRDGMLKYIAVPAAVFNDVMTMRCCEEALAANPDNGSAIALWLAANFRREARLGMNVERDQPDPLSDKDATRPENFPRAVYFARAAGARYNQMVLARAVRDRDPGVALGAIAALRETAGAPNLVGAEDLKQPLVQSLAFPSRQVRIKAALALGRALPKSEFSGAKDVVPVLAEALLQSGRMAALVIDADVDMANKFQAALRAAGFDCAAGANLYQGLENGQKANLAAFDVILLASDIAQPDLAGAIAELRKQFQTAATPILVVAKAADMTKARAASRAAAGVDILLADVVELGDPAKIQQEVSEKIQRAAQALGMSQLGGEAAMELAMQAADVLRGIGESNLKVFDFSKAVSALITSLSSKSDALRIKCAGVLALANSADGQAAIAQAALDAQRGKTEREVYFAALAESARRNGNLLGGGGDLVAKLIDFTMNEPDLVLRAAASKALGALDLPGNKASEIIRANYRG